MSQIELPIKLNPDYYEGLELKLRRGHSRKFTSTGFLVRKFIVGRKDHRGYIKVHERNLRGFDWLLTEREISKFFEEYKPKKSKENYV